MGDTLVLRNLALDMIKRKNLQKARLALLKSLSIDSYLHDTFTLLGDVYYLENKRTEATNYYLASMHLFILSSIEGTNEKIIDEKFNSLSDDLKSSLPSKYALYVLNEYTIAEHLAHSLIPNGSFGQAYEKVYKDALITKMTIETVLSRYEISHEEYLEYRNSHLIPLGREYLIKNIHWNLIYSKNVCDIYINK